VSNLSPKLRRLDEKLGKLDALLLSELDGLLAGVIVSPDFIPPSEWLPCIWDGGPHTSGPVFKNDADIQETINLVMYHYNQIIADLEKGRYVPIFDGFEDDDDFIMWERWACGFMTAIRLRPKSWQTYVHSRDEDISTAAAILMTLGNIADEGDNIENPALAHLDDEAPDLIPSAVLALHGARIKSQENPFAKPQQAHASKVGRNEPCPCGSGKKYKKCCGLN
jgi:uncharacterized protein